MIQAIDNNVTDPMLATKPVSEHPVVVNGRANIKSLTALRFLAAALIVLVHCSQSILKGHLGFVETCALHQGVSFFFVLSGFVLLYSHQNASSDKGTWNFLVARIARIWPSHLTALLLFALLFQAWWLPIGKVLPWITLANCFLVHSWIPNSSVFYSLNAPSWSISTEFFFYLAFPFLVRDWSKTWTQKLAASAVITASILAFCAWLQWHGTRSSILVLYEALIYINPCTRLFEFVLGMAAAEAFARINHVQISSRMASLLEGLLFGSALLNLYLTPLVLGPQHAVSFMPVSHWLYYSSGAPLYAALIAIFALQKGIISNCLSNRVMVFLGEISYSIYIYHWIVLQWFSNTFSTGSPWLQFAAYSSVVLAVSTISFFAIEQPARCFIRAKFAKSTASPQRLNNRRLALLLIIVVCALTALAYRPVISNSFLGDDYVALVWLKKAFSHPELIVRNFQGPWLQSNDTKFYRPIQGIFFVADYWLSKTDATGFHLTNLVLLLLTAAVLFFIVRELQFATRSDNHTHIGFACPFAAALLFGLYPLHPETVSWITGRVDSIAGIFIFASLWCYMRWRRTNGGASQLAALSFMMLGLLSKETAIVLPLLFLSYEIFVKFTARHSARTAFIMSALKRTGVFWAALALYFAMRRLALGTFVGGYDDSISFVSNWQMFIYSWVHALRMTLEPINRSISSDFSVLNLGWLLCLISTFTLCVHSLRKNGESLRYAVFCLSWFALALVPVYKIFAISNDLQGSRFAYIASAPLCMIMARALLNYDHEKPVLALARRGLLATLALLSFLILGVNNRPWVEAERTSTAIQTALKSFYSEIKGDPQVLLVGLPDQIHGAYVCRNAVDGMTKAPQFPRDISNCLMVNDFERVLPIGFLKQSLFANCDQVKIAQWDPCARVFRNVTLEIPSSNADYVPTDLARICHPSNVQTACALSDENVPPNHNTFDVRASSSASVHPEIELDPSHTACFGVDFVDVTVEIARSNYAGPMSADLTFTNDISSAFKASKTIDCVHSDVASTPGPQELIFALRGLPDWTLGGDCRQLKIKFPEGAVSRISRIRFVAANALMPSINFENCGYLGTKGFMHLGLGTDSNTVNYDATNIRGARGIIFEITRPNLPFESPNSTRPSTVLMKEIHAPGASGIIQIKRELFPTPGIYQGRAWAVDSSGARIGVAGDHMIFAIDS